MPSLELEGRGGCVVFEEERIAGMDRDEWIG